MPDSGNPAPTPESDHTVEISKILERSSRGDPTAASELLPIVYDQLRALAKRRMASERPEHTLQATALVHEAYTRLVGEGHNSWDGQAHFYAATAEAIRRILIEHARSRGRAKRGGNWRRVSFDSIVSAPEFPDTEEIVSVDDAIRRLEERDPRAAQIVRLRFYTGLEMQEIAGLLQINERTVRRDWTLARAWLHRDLIDRGQPSTYTLWQQSDPATAWPWE